MTRLLLIGICFLAASAAGSEDSRERGNAPGKLKNSETVQADAHALEPAFIFSDGAVLQRDMEVPVWGWGTPGANVSVSFAGQQVSTRVKGDGGWRVTLDPMKATATGATMVVQEADKEIRVNDIVVGEVWFCSGQSNMVVPLKRLAAPPRDPQLQPIADFMKEEISRSADPLLRFCEVKSQTAKDEPLRNGQGRWFSVSPARSKVYATAYFFGKELRSELDVPVGLIQCAFGGKRIESFMPKSAFDSDPELSAYKKARDQELLDEIADYDHEAEEAKYAARLERWKTRVDRAKAAGDTLPRKPRKWPVPTLDSPKFPTSIYNGMIGPLATYGIRGVIWYQGEHNTLANANADQYRKRLHALISSWRQAWGQGEFPFYYCQLANIGHNPRKPENSKRWCIVSNQMRLAMDMENTGMAVLNDIGEPDDIHPRNKVDVGKRLSLWALAKTYGKKDLVFSGPIYKSSERENSKIVVRFDHAAEGLMTARKNLLDPARPVDEPVGGFEICGPDGNWIAATAEIIPPDSVEVHHPDINRPVQVRYAWRSNPVNANLYNSAGLPTSIFKTGEIQ